MITVNMEKLKTGNVRVTGRIDGRTASMLEGAEAKSKDMCLAVIKDIAGAHMINGKVDQNFVDLSESVKKAISE